MLFTASTLHLSCMSSILLVRFSCGYDLRRMCQGFAYASCALAHGASFHLAKLMKNKFCTKKKVKKMHYLCKQE